MWKVTLLSGLDFTRHLLMLKLTESLSSFYNWSFIHYCWHYKLNFVSFYLHCITWIETTKHLTSGLFHCAIKDFILCYIHSTPLHFLFVANCKQCCVNHSRLLQHVIIDWSDFPWLVSGPDNKVQRCEQIHHHTQYHTSITAYNHNKRGSRPNTVKMWAEERFLKNYVHKNGEVREEWLFCNRTEFCKVLASAEAVNPCIDRVRSAVLLSEAELRQTHIHESLSLSLCVGVPLHQNKQISICIPVIQA